MNPPSSTKKPEKDASRPSPFDEISSVEEREEARLQRSLAKIGQEHGDGERAIQSSEEKAANGLREAAREEVRAFASSEPASILQRYHAETEKETARIEAIFQKHGAKTAQTLVESIVDLSFLRS